jgi:hypothetical protein
MTGHGQKLSRKKEQAIAALLSKPSIPEAAAEVGIGEKTLWRWLQVADFKDSYRAARREVVAHAIAQVQAGLGDAVKTLQDIMSDSDAPASARVSAARTMIDMGVKAVEVEDIEGRISKLEKLINERKKT